MFSGAGVVAGGSQSASMRCRKRKTGLSAGASDSEIFYNLGIGRVHFVSDSNWLYFIESADSCIPDILAPVFQGMQSQPDTEQLYLDPHHLLKAAKRLRLKPEEVVPVLAALRLSGIDISSAE